MDGPKNLGLKYRLRVEEVRGIITLTHPQRFFASSFAIFS